MINLFEFTDYKAFLRAKLEGMPKRGWGEMQKISTALAMHSTRVSQVIGGDVHFTLEQASKLCDYLDLSALESEYFLVLTNEARAGTPDLRARFKQQAQRIRERANELEHRVPREKVLTEEQKSLFYSSWAYSGLRLATSLPGPHNIDSLAERFGLPKEKVGAIMEFLLKAGLCVEGKEGFVVGPQSTHLNKTSPLVLRHHANWRLKALARHENLGEGEMAYTCPVSLTKEDQLVVREMLFRLIERFLKRAAASDPPDTLACLNIDWFRVS